MTRPLKVLRDIPAYTTGQMAETMNRTAQRIGTVAGTAVGTARDLSERIQAVPERISTMRDRLAETGREMREDAAEMAHEWKRSVQEGVRQTRERASQFVNENPFYVIAGVAAVAFSLGIALQMWRSTRD